MRWEQISEHHRKRAKLLLMFFQFAHLNHISHKEDQLRAYPLQPNNKSAFAFCHTTGVIGNQNHRGFCCRARYRSTSPHGDSRAAFFSGWLGYKQGAPWLLEPLVRTKSHFKERGSGQGSGSLCNTTPAERPFHFPAAFWCRFLIGLT